MSRLGEINKGSPKLLYSHSHSGDLRCFERVCASLRREGSRLSKIPRKFTVPLFEPSPKRRGLAWVRPFSLSEELGESSVMFDRFLESWMVNTCLDFMDGVWWISMGWFGTWKGLVIKVDKMYIYIYIYIYICVCVCVCVRACVHLNGTLH